MTAPALVWRQFDASTSPSACAFGGCEGPPTFMRGPRTPLMHLPWRSYCRAHASLYGVTGRRRLSPTA